MRKKLKLHWLFNRSMTLFFLSFFGLIVVAICINMIGIQITGTVESWQHYLKQHSNYFLVWRVALYSLIIVGWLWAKKRIMTRENHQDEQSTITIKQRILRIEITTTIAFLVLEVSNWLGR